MLRANIVASVTLISRKSHGDVIINNFQSYVSVKTDLVTSLEFRPIPCATRLCHFGQKRNGYVATHSSLFSTTAESSATSGYVVVPERFGQNKE